MSFNINVTGYPYPQVVFSRFRGTLSTVVSASLSTIYFTNVNRTDAGFYEFSWFNNLGIAHIGINLTVICKFIAILYRNQINYIGSYKHFYTILI